MDATPQEPARPQDEQPGTREESRVILIIGISIFVVGLLAYGVKKLADYSELEQPTELTRESAYGALTSALGTVQEKLVPGSDVVPDKQRKYNEAFIALVIDHLSPTQKAILDKVVGVARTYVGTFLSVEFWLVALTLAVCYYAYQRGLRL